MLVKLKKNLVEEVQCSIFKNNKLNLLLLFLYVFILNSEKRSIDQFYNLARWEDINSAYYFDYDGNWTEKDKNPCNL